jgi:hydroxymethylpyrimidine pyrophosphatase-like HAD family hydrolase
MEPIVAIFSDNEGCILPGKGIEFPLQELAKLRSFLKKHPYVGFGICSGRSVPFIEAMVQTLNLFDSSVPCICEGGAALYWPKLDRWEAIAPTIDRKNIIEAVEGLSYREELGKVTCVSLYPENKTTIRDLYLRLINSPIAPQYHISYSSAAVDVTATGIDKAYGIKEVCKRLKLPLSQILCIGDSDNDLPMLKIAGYSACPNNAIDAVKKEVDFIAKSNSTAGIVEILRHFKTCFINVASSAGQ